MGFTLSPVCATQYDYYINGNVGDVFHFDDYKHNSVFFDNRGASIAFMKSDLFTGEIESSDDLDNWVFTAVKPGFKVVEVDHWFWADPNYYYFDIEP
jgi:hypothetical protein